RVSVRFYLQHSCHLRALHSFPTRRSSDLILDELTTSLDPQARRAIWRLIERVRAQGVTILLVTHFMDEAEYLCDRIALINAGRIVVLDTPQGIVAGVRASVQREELDLDDAFLTLTEPELMAVP